MKGSRTKFMLSDNALLALFALASFVLHVLVNDRYGFHRDELAMIDDARHLAWGFVAYPPVTPLVARLSMALFGTSLVGVRMLVAAIPSLVIVLAGLMARDMGGGRRAQIVAALATAVAPLAMHIGGRMDYVPLDYLWWVLLATLVIRLLTTEDPRWWLGIGAVIGLGMMTKYTMAVFIIGLGGGLILTPARRYLRSPWLWAGAVIALLIVLPNVIWQAQHDFVSLDFTRSIHERDINIGRADDFLPQQLLSSASIFTVPLWIAGLYAYFFGAARTRYRMIGWMYVISLVLFVVMQGRSYYLAPAYPMLLAGGAVAWERWLATRARRPARVLAGITWAGLAVGAVTSGLLLLPIAPINSDVWDIAADVHDNFTEEIGWQELVDTVATVYHGLPADELSRTAIWAANYGEAGALSLYGPAHDLPAAISPVNSFWYRGYGDTPPDTVIALGVNAAILERYYFESCEFAAPITNRYGVKNEETEGDARVYICRGPRHPWPEMWDTMQFFG